MDELLLVDETTVAKLERGEHKPSKILLNKLNGVFNSIDLKNSH
ncbi:MAG TPA: hypothetical protein DEE98_01675 [Elusimicrobia bacterium]|nr:hypothetical protein [Elusimicrobiota bacterium]